MPKPPHPAPARTVSLLDEAERRCVYQMPELAILDQVTRFDAEKHDRVLRAWKSGEKFNEMIELTQENQQEVLTDQTIMKRVTCKELVEEYKYLALCQLGLEYLNMRMEIEDYAKGNRIFAEHLNKAVRA